MGYTFIRKRVKLIAYLLLFNMVVSVLQPISALALTSGPSQPESQSFQPAGVSDMVDLFSGDFKYNIPLMDVDGYPLNLNYQSGVGMDDEASWVGLGWNLNAGSINRQLRGVPDDFSGDTLITSHYTKPKITVGGRLTAKVEVKGKAKLGGSFSFGVFSDNYTGIGAELGVNAGMSFSLANGGLLTSSMGIGVLSNTSSGVDVSPNVSLSISELSKSKGTANAGLSSSLGYNSRSGLKSLTLGRSFTGYNQSSPAVSYNTEPIAPKIQIPYRSDYGSFSFDVGGVAWAVFGGVGGTGYRSERSVVQNDNINTQYGFLYAEQGKDKKGAVQDFIREKENPVINELPNLALPIHTPDIFTYNSQTGSGQFRLYRGGTGVFFDNEVTDVSEVNTDGIDIGFGAYAHGGVTKFAQTTTNTTRKWTGGNNYLKNGDFQDPSKINPQHEHVYFRKVDDKNIEDLDMTTKLQGTSALAVNISSKTANSSFAVNTNYLNTNIPVSSPITKQQRAVKNTNISYLTAKEARQAALDKTIKTYDFLDSATFNPLALVAPVPTVKQRNSEFRKNHHISEITVTGNGSERMVYGIPVYNKKQEEYSFALGGNNSKDNEYNVITGNLVGLNSGAGNVNYKKGIDHYFHKESQPAYASSYLLTAVLSPDYIDKTGNGISDDDLGTAMKFNYSKIENYKWRTPYAARASGQTTLNRTAALNRGLLADPDDDKGSIIYGEKEIYYVHSIESKTQIAYFITADRLDGLGVLSWEGDRDLNATQKVLKEIRLYSKADLTKPIKTVKFAYSYELCKGVPNSIGGANNTPDLNGTTNGKLTLKKVWFEYGNSPKGKEHPYTFTYNNKGAETSAVNYTTMATDRWGTYKNAVNNPNGLSNEEYPYTLQNKGIADANAALYHLTKIDLPTGGTIEVAYEADDYAYVQNKKAAAMVPVEAVEGAAEANSLEGGTGIKIHLDSIPPTSVNTDATRLDWFKNTYLSGSNYMYTRFYVKIGTDEKLSKGLNWDFISTYCKIRKIDVAGSTATVFFEITNEAGVQENPIRFSAWQKMKNEYPRYAYPGFMNRVGDESSTAKAAVTAIVNAAKNLTELKENFYAKAKRKGYAKYIDMAKSFVRISKINGYKTGGGVRVKNIKINDNWKTFTGDTDAQPGVYGQSYEYTTFDGRKKISSGVASYEPAVGNDENPLKQPIPYIQKIKGAINNYFELEEPFGEALFPSAGVGYSKVLVRDLDANGNEDSNPKTGTVINEFYTAKDFPVRVQILPIQKYNPRPANTYSLVKTNSIEEMTLSQGYSIELNDMHGKSKAMRILNHSGSEISSTVYHYGVEDVNATEQRLNNKVDVIDSNGQLKKDVYIGRDIELFTDFREQESKNTGDAINIGIDIIPFFFGIPLPVPHWPVNGNNEYKLFRSACAVKVIQNYGILKKVVKTENGSSIFVENVAYDGVTGDAVVTKTQNEFDKNYYSVNLPAYWIYKGMGPAYQNLGILFQNIATNASGAITNSTFSGIAMAGDELVDISNGTHYWVIETAGSKRLIDLEGNVQEVNIAVAKIIRSGYRNVLQSATSTLVCQENPIQGTVFKLGIGGDLSSLKVISASTNLFDEKWAGKVDVNNNGMYLKNTNESFEFRATSNIPLTNFYEHGNINNLITIQSEFFKGGEGTGFYYRSGIKLLDERPLSNFDSAYIYRAGFSACINVPATKDYCIAAAGGYNVISNSGGFQGYGPVLHVNKLRLYQGNNIIYMLFDTYNPGVPGNPNMSTYNYGGLEIYDNTVSEVVNADNSGTGINIIFSSGSLRDQIGYFNYKTFIGPNIGDYGSIYHYTDQYGNPVSSCDDNLTQINPYLNGLLGSWHPYQTKVYQEARKYNDIFNSANKGMDLQNAGAYKTFSPWWKNSGSQWMIDNQTGWTTANTVTLYDKYGQELENKDALGRYSAASFDFNGELPAAVASNAMNREVFLNSFEDTKFKAQHNIDIARVKLTIAPSGQSISSLITATHAHTGNYSLTLNTSGVQLNTKLHTQEHKTADYLFASASGYNILSTPGLYPNGFEPVPSKKYIISTWVKDGQPTNRNVNIAIAAKGSGSPIPISLSCKAIVEGWKLLEGEINMASISGTALQLTIKSNAGNVYIDDVRIHPYDAHVKSYAYSDKSFKLMAELDENAFATFYEYDDSGSLVRVKKETERGIITIKESRSSYRKKI